VNSPQLVDQVAITSPGQLADMDWDFADAKTDALTHRLHPYPAKYIPQIPHLLIQALSRPGDTVADIFCGSGTTLVEALVSKRHAIGVDANALACLITEAKTTRFARGDEDLLQSLVKRAQALADSISTQNYGMFAESKSFISDADRPQDDAIAFWFEPFVIEELAEIRSWCDQLSTESSRKVAWVAFSSNIVVVSKQDSDTRYVRREKSIAPGDTMRRFARSLTDAIRAVSTFTNTTDPHFTRRVYCTDVLNCPDIGRIDLMVCSPPYPNAYSYHLYHMTRMLWLGMDQVKFKREEIGSHRKYSRKGANGATAETFRNEMTTILDWLRLHLKMGGYACFVVGDSTIKGERIDNADLIADVATLRGFSESARIYRRMQDTKKAFNPSIGKIKTEKILVLQRT
jgi:hypothetical protein